MLKKIVKEFNSFFAGKAKAKVAGDKLEITIGFQTIVIRLPGVVGVQSRGSS